MKIKAFLISLFTVLSSVLSLQAQFYVGVQGGVGVSTQQWSNTGVYSRFSLPSLVSISRPQGGLLFGYQINKSFALQAELNYLTKGTHMPYQSFNSSFSLTRTTSFNYFEIPLLVRYSLPNIVESLDIDILVGANVGILESIYGKGYVDTTGSNGTTGRIEFDSQLPKENVSTYDISIGGGLGVRYAVSNSGHIFCTGRYMVGLTDILPVIDRSVYNRTLHLNLGYMLTL